MTGAQVRLIAVGLAIAGLARAQPQAPARTSEPAFLALPNRLVVVFAPDPTVSSVVVHVRYRDGARSERAAEAGFTHLVERLLFAGSVHVKAGEYETRIDGAGGFTGSLTTGEDLTVWEQVPAGALELALWLEAERMAGLADGISDPGIASARATIAAEYRSAYVDQPYGLVARAAGRALWGASYHDVLGDEQAVAHATREQVEAFVRTRIRPERATIVIAGAFDVDTAMAMTRRYFGWIPGRPVADDDTPPAVVPLQAAARVTVKDPVAKVVVAFRLPDPDDPALLTLEVAARVLVGSRGARLQQSLLDAGLATDVDASIVRERSGGELRITATPRANVPLGKLADVVLAEVARLAREPLAEPELDRAVATVEIGQLTALEGLVYRASVLAKRPLDEITQLSRRASAISPLLLQRTVATWLAERASVVITGDPEAR